MNDFTRQKSASSPRLSVVIVTPDNFSTIQKTVAKLQIQTVRDEIELIIVAPHEKTLAPPPGALDGFASHRVIETGAKFLVADTRAKGAFAASAPIVAYAEDHCFPESDWAEKLLAAFHKLTPQFVAVGPRFYNANPHTALSWADFIANFGQWNEQHQSREAEALAWHNTAYRREILTRYGIEKLARFLEVEGTLQDDIRGRGEKLYLESEAHVHHLNMSVFASGASCFFHSGRLFGATRSRSWNPLRHLAYSMLSPFIFLTRLRGQFSHLQRSITSAVLPKSKFLSVRTLMLLYSLIHIAGEAIGYLLGSGDAAARKSDLETRRLRFMSRADRENEYSSLRVLDEAAQPQSIHP